jgi:hypothetical protein
MLRIDADAHVLETEKTWEYMEGAERRFRPQVVGANDGSSTDEYWLVDGTLRLKSRNVGKNTPMASRELRDVNARLKHIDKLGVDVQVIFPTIFIIPLTPRPEIEVALCRSYNRWMADIWRQAKERLRWSRYCRCSAWTKFMTKQSLRRRTARWVFFSADRSAISC